MRTMAIDGNNLIIRSVKATEGRVEMSADGIYTAHLVVFINSLSRYVRETKPDRVVICWDTGRSARRVAIYPEYKASRRTSIDIQAQDAGGDFTPTPEQEAKESAFGLARTFLSLAGLHHVAVPGVEADDLIAYYWRSRAPGDEYVILSGDKDFFQLLDATTTQHRPGPETDLWTEDRVLNDLNCIPLQLPDIMALSGDSIDGVPGAAGFGHKTACKFLAKYDWNLDRLLAAGEAKLSGQEEIVRISRQLVDLRKTDYVGIDMPPLPRFEPTNHMSPLWMALLEYLDQYQLRSIKERLVTGTLWSS